MQPLTEAQVLAHMMDRARQYTRLYLSPLKDQDPHRQFVCEGKPLNTLFWLVAHLATSENGLLLRATGGPFEKFSWAKHYTLGSQGLPREQAPPYEEVWATFKAVHEKAMAHLPTLTDAQLLSPNTTGLSAIGGTTRDVVTHAIRHEALHTGHISWLCKLYGVKTM
jgi:uncharacterized damage-inducible protein DinB